MVRVDECLLLCGIRTALHSDLKYQVLWLQISIPSSYMLLLISSNPPLNRTSVIVMGNLAKSAPSGYRDQQPAPKTGP